MEIIQSLIQILGQENVLYSLEERKRYSAKSATGTFVPDVVVRPQGTQQVVEIMKLAVAHKVPLIPRGAGTGLRGETLSVQGGIVLDFSQMNRILEIDAKNLLAIVEPGLVTAQLQKALEEIDLFYPPDPINAQTCTIGGNVATGAGGPRGMKYGVTRDFVMGLEVVTPAGEVIRTGGKTVKNVSGYDFTRLFVGSEGTIGIITKVILKLLPKPEAKLTMLALFPKLDGAANTVPQIIAQGIIPSSLEVMDKVALDCLKDSLIGALSQKADAVLLIEVDGDKEVIEKQVRLITDFCQQNGASEVKLAKEQEADELWAARRAVSAVLMELNAVKIAENASVPRTQIPEMLKRLKMISSKYNLLLPVYGHVGEGNLHLNVLTKTRDTEEMARVEKAVKEILELTLELGGSLTGEYGVGFKFTPEEMNFYREIKKVFDPHNLLNPGKILGGE